MSAPIRLMLVEDHEVVREGLRSLLESRPGFEVVGEAQDGRKAVAMALERKPDVVVMDISLPVLNGIEATRQIVAGDGKVGVVGLSVHAEERIVSELLKAGARGYVPKRCAAQELFDAIVAVNKGRVYISPEVAGAVLSSQNKDGPRPARDAFTHLTPREREVLQLMAEGQSTKRIAATLSLSVPTIHTHRQSLMRKLNLHSVAEITKYAIREGLTTLEHG
jgi:DNA-binding NarL/FixJ family response regulator